MKVKKQNKCKIKTKNSKSRKQNKCKWTSPFFPMFFHFLTFLFLSTVFPLLFLLLCFLDFADLLFVFSIFLSICLVFSSLLILRISYGLVNIMLKLLSAISCEHRCVRVRTWQTCQEGFAENKNAEVDKVRIVSSSKA